MVYLDRTIVSDLSLRGEKLEYAFVQTTDRECISAVLIFHQCGFTYKVDEKSISHHYNIFALKAPKTVHLLKGAQTGRITSTTGQEYLWHRIFSVLIGFGVSGFTLLSCISAFGPKQPTRPNAPPPQQFAPRARPSNTGQSSFGKRSRYS